MPVSEELELFIHRARLSAAFRASYCARYAQRVAFWNNLAQVLTAVSASTAVGLALAAGSLEWLGILLGGVAAVTAAVAAAFFPTEKIRRATTAATQWSLRAAGWDSLWAGVLDDDQVGARDFEAHRLRDAEAYVTLEGLPYRSRLAGRIQAEIISREGLDGDPETRN